MDQKEFDILIIGAGHAGVEAAHIASQFSQLKIGMITLPGVDLASAPCNPSIGGVGKGQVVREIDHLGGIMGKAADLAGIQFRTLNESKGFAVHSTRVQIDKKIYPRVIEELLSELKNLTIIREKVLGVGKDRDFIITTSHSLYFAKKVILTVGTFLNGKLHFGEKSIEGGRVDTESSGSLSELLSDIRLNPKRFKTGTPPRLRKSSINFDKLEPQDSDPEVETFHVLHGTFERFSPQQSCYLTYTNSETMKTIRDNKERSPMFNGQIKATGARYCPSIEDKAFRYPDKDIHHVFVEPESETLETYYPSGISSSLPEEVQEDMVHSISGLENAEIVMPGYAVEYDVLDTTQLDRTLQVQALEGMYFAGQVNGTSGYEEAAGQGLIAGVNAALSLLGKDSFVLNRNDSYIGVMIEDLVSNLRDEPYRLFTARSENRLMIREDNAALRMWSYRTKLGLNEEIDRYLKDFNTNFQVYFSLIENTDFKPNDLFLMEHNIETKKKISLLEVLKLSQVNPVDVLSSFVKRSNLNINHRLIKALAISIKYSGYINKSEEINKKVSRLDDKPISWKDLSKSENISFECKQRIQAIKPETFGQLRRIEGIRQATLSAVAGQYY